jgi:uncharacterized protein
MDRRKLIVSTLAVAGATGVAAATGKAAAGAATMRVVYHLADLEKVSFVLGNVQNHIAGAGGADRVTIAVVVHGPALQAFRRAADNIAITTPMTALTRQGIAFHACGNTLKAMKLAGGDLLAGFDVVEQGGVVKLAELQSQGWIYLRP